MRKIIAETVNRLITEGQKVLGTKFTAGQFGDYQGVDLKAFAKWQAGCANLIRVLGAIAEPWKGIFSLLDNRVTIAIGMMGALEAIQEAAQHGLLVKVEDLTRAEAFEGLLEQAEYLDGEGYFLAAGVLGRAVLESHLRKWCEVTKCLPSKPKPTINDFNASLYRDKHINKMEMKHIEAMATIGNSAAHNDPMLTKEDAERLLRDVRDLLIKHSEISF